MAAASVLTGGAEPRAVSAEHWDVNDLAIYLWPDEPTAKLMTAASVLTGGAEPRGEMQSGTHNLAKCQLTGWTNCHV